MSTLILMTVRVGVREFRENLSMWLDRAAAGEEIVVTERGAPKVRIEAANAESLLARLVREGRATPPTKPRRPVALEGDGDGSSPVTDSLFEQRRSKDY